MRATWYATIPFFIRYLICNLPFQPWDEIDLGDALRTVPGARMKGAEDHRVPLSGAAMDVLSEALRAAGRSP